MTRWKRADVLVLLALLGCDPSSGVETTESQPEVEAPPSKKLIAVARTSMDKTLDPVGQFDTTSSVVISNVYDTLLQFHYLKRPYEVVPNIVEAMPTISQDGLTYSFELRKDVFFHDDECFPGGKGRAVTVEDVIYSFKRYADAKNTKSYTQLQGQIVGMDEFRELTGAEPSLSYDEHHIAGLTRRGERTLDVRLTSPNRHVLAKLAITPLSIVPREAVEHYGSKFAQHPVGTGPFRMREYSRRGRVVLEKHPRYHGVYPAEGAPGDREAGLLAAAGKRLPLVDEVILTLFEEPQPRMLQFLKGELDLLGANPHNFPGLAEAVPGTKRYQLKPKHADRFTIGWTPTLTSFFLAVNMKDELVGTNRALRQALALAVDRHEYVKLLDNGRGRALESIVPRAIVGGGPELRVPWHEWNVDRARKRLAEAGYPDGKGLPPIFIDYTRADQSMRQTHEFLRDQLARIGVTVEPRFQTFSRYLEKIDSGNFQIAYRGWGAVMPDAENLHQLLYGANTAPGPNVGGFDHAEYNELYERSRLMEDGPQRLGLLRRMSEIIRDEVPVLLLNNPDSVVFRQKRVRNHKPSAMLYSAFRYMDVAGPTGR